MDSIAAVVDVWWGVDLSAKVAALAIAATALGIVLLMASILFLHLRATIAARRHDRLRGEWIATLLDPASCPSRLVVRERDAVAFLLVCSQLLDSIRGDFRESLVAFVHRTEVPALLRRLLRHGSYRQRILCASALGNLRDQESSRLLGELARDNDSFLSLTAASALVGIHSHDSIRKLLPQMVQRADWPLSQVHAALMEVDPAMVGEVIAQAVEQWMPQVPLRALRLLPLVAPGPRSRLIRGILANGQTLDAESEAAVLDAIEDPQLVDLVASRLGHARWEVVVVALKAMARIGSAADMPRIHPLLEHPQWWVRYRAARALAGLPGIKPIEIELLAARHPDPYARDMLRFALSEQAIQ